MSSGFKQPITIKEAIDNIYNRYYLIPAIQRKFTWSSEQIEMLFDSIMRGYPINSFMLWKICAPKLKSDYKFYQFLTNYREFFADDNLDIDTTGVPDFEAVVDGQQRLTSLYIGLRGTYAYKMPRKWLKDNEDSIPTRRLYLCLSESVNQEYDNQKKYDFRFLTSEEYMELSKKSTWFLVKDILDLDSLQKVNKYINDNHLQENEYASDTLIGLFSRIHKESLVNFYLQEEQDSDKVLEIFIRTNSGGTPLTFSDLLMSISSANWKTIDARKEIKDVIDKVYEIGKPSFIISKDFILKTCLVLYIDNIKFQLKNFTQSNVKLFEDNWSEIKKSILAAFTLFEKLGFNDKSFRAKNAAIPIIYYIHRHNLADKINTPLYDKEDEEIIVKWLILSFIKSIFGGQSDSVIATIRSVLRETKSNKFPAQEIMDAFKSESKNYSIDDDFITGLLEAQKDSNEAFYLLRLLYPKLDYQDPNLHQDHLHPATYFLSDEKLNACGIPNEDIEFAKDDKNWNSVSNLQLLVWQINESKNDKLLAEWAKETGVSNESMFLSKETSLDIKDFKSFIIDRRKNIRDYLKKLIDIS